MLYIPNCCVYKYPPPQADWLRFDDADAFAGQDAALLKTGDPEACKAPSRGGGSRAVAKAMEKTVEKWRIWMENHGKP